MINFKLFKKIIHAILRHAKSNEKFSKFLEEKICQDSFCFVTYGNKLSDLIIELLCNNFNIPYSENGRTYDNLITWWLYEDVDKKIYYKTGEVRDINNIKDFYKYLCELKAENGSKK